MSKPRGSRGSRRISQSAETREIIKGDYPSPLKAAMLLQVKGGRQRTRRCVGCGAPGTHCNIFIPDDALAVGGDPDRRRYRVYWVCHACHVAGISPGTEAKLQGGSR